MKLNRFLSAGLFSAFLFILFPSPAPAWNFLGVEPGQTLRQEAEKTLGAPAKDLGNNCYQYSISNNAGNLQLSVQYNKNIVDLLALDFNATEYKAKLTEKQARELFGLEKEGFSRPLPEGSKLVGYQRPLFLALVPAGNKASLPLSQLIYLSPRQYAAQQAIAQNTELAETGKGLFLTEKDFAAATKYYFSQAEKLRDAKDLEGAWQAAWWAYELAPEEKKHQELSLTLAEKLGKLETAKDILRQLLQSEPNNIKFLDQLGIILCKQNKLEQAEKSFNKILEIRPKDARALSLLAWIRTKQNRIDEALDYINRALAIIPNDAICLNRKGCCLKIQGKYDEALKLFEQAAKANPAMAAPYVNMAEIYKAQGKDERALQAYTKVLELDPTEGNANVLDNFRKQPSVKINKVWAEHGATEGKEKGLRIHVNFLAKNLQHKDLWAGAFFLDDKNRPAPCNDTTYIDSNKETRIYRSLKPGFKKTTFNDFTLFIPYRAFAPQRGKHNYKCEVGIFQGSRTLAKKDFSFIFTQSGDAPRANIQKIWLDHYARQGNKTGLLIHVKFRIENLKGKKIGINAFFNDSKGQKVLSATPEYTSPEGQATIQLDTTPGYVDATYKDFKLFFPYYAFFTYKGKYDYTCSIEIKNGNICLTKKGIDFQFTRD